MTTGAILNVIQPYLDTIQERIFANTGTFLSVTASMKGDRKRRRTLVHTIRRPRVTTAASSSSPEHQPVPWTRLSKDDYDAVVTPSGSTVGVRILDSEGTPADVRLLRPARAALGGAVNPGTEPCCSDSEVHGYRIIHMSKCAEMWNACFKEHASLGTCGGNLQYDTSREVKVGLAWREALKCDRCGYHSDVFKLYQEVETGKPGPNPADINRSVQVGLAETMISNTALRTILLAADIPAPSTRSMQSAANSVGEKLIKLGQECMEDERQHLKQLNIACGLPAESPIMAEGDCRYNNALRSAGGTTPFQPATQAVYTVCENNTPKKKIIAVCIKNKLAKEPESGSDSDESDTFLAKDATIGDERAWAYECAKDLARSGTIIQHFTTDGDSKQVLGLSDAYKELNIKVTPENLRDPGHLSCAQKKKLKDASFSPAMFPAKTKEGKKQQRIKMVYDITDRCKAEFTNCLSAMAGDVQKTIKGLSHARDSVIACLQGDHDMCRKKSYACRGTLRKRWTFTRLGDVKVMPNTSDTRKLIDLIDMRLGAKAVQATRLGTNTQKCESVNRSYLRTNPKCVTLRRNFAARIHSAVHTLNVGYANTVIQKTAAVGAKVTGQALKQLKSEQKKRDLRARLARSRPYRRRRVDRVKQAYNLHKQARVSKTEITYRKHMLDMELLRHKKNVVKEHSYAQSRAKQTADHSYAKR